MCLYIPVSLTKPDLEWFTPSSQPNGSFYTQASTSIPPVRLLESNVALPVNMLFLLLGLTELCKNLLLPCGCWCLIGNIAEIVADILQIEEEGIGKQLFILPLHITRQIIIAIPVDGCMKKL